MSTGTYSITHRRMESSPSGTHVHVGWVKLLDGTVLTRQRVVNYIRQGILFNTYVPSTGHQARVHLLHCSRCNTTYLTTARDAWKDDNLDRLPTF